MAKTHKDETRTTLLTKHRERLDNVVQTYQKAFPKDELSDILPVIIRDVMLVAKDYEYDPKHIHSVAMAAYLTACKQKPGA